MKGTGTDMKHINSAVRLLDIAAEKYSDKIAVADELIHFLENKIPQ